MKLISQTPRIELILKPHQLLSLGQVRHRMAIECKQGVLWVTSSGDHDDHLLYAGQRFTPVNNRKLVIEAIKDACVDIEEQ
ncbi:MAG: DUF2917 domain-containing protein [Anaerolineales bacterium]